LFPAICSLTLDGNDGNGDDVKVNGAVMATRLLGNFGRYSVQPFRILYETGNGDDGDDDDEDYNDDDDEDDDDDDAEEADGMPMTVAWHTTPSPAATLMAN
jgi:hypothetical protein